MLKDKGFDSMAKILDSPIEELTTVLEKLTLGELTSFMKMMEIQYQQLEVTKDQLITLPKENEAEHAIEGLYGLLQKVEDIAKVVEELRKQRIVKVLK